MAIYTGAGLLFGRLMRRRWQAVALPALGVVLGMIVGLSRVYLGVHYPMDVFAGWMGGLACALIGAGASATPGANEGDLAASSS
jgi:undecaprenyl-diphosphatase